MQTGDKSTNCPNKSSYDKTPPHTTKQEYQLTSQDQALQISFCATARVGRQLERQNAGIQAFEMKCLPKILGISYPQRRTNESIRQVVGVNRWKTGDTVGHGKKRRKMNWFGHIYRHNSLAKTILQGTVEGGRKRGRPTKSWLDNIKDWTGLNVGTSNRKLEYRPTWARITANSCHGTPRITGHGS